MEEVRLGTIGSGVIVHSLLRGVRETEGIRLEAAYSRTEDTAMGLAAVYGAEKTYTDMDAFLADGSVNCVYVATPNLLHYEQVKRALIAGKHVICEKPFVTRADHAEELFALAESRGLFLFEAAPTTFLPNYAILKRELAKVGRVRLVMANYSQYSSRYDAVLRGERPNIFSLEFAGGCLMDINFYNVLLNVALFGRPESAEYFPNIFPGPGLADTSGVFVMRYDGFVSTNAGAKDTWGINHFTIEGEQGYIHVDEPNGIKSVRVVTRDSDDTYNLQPVPDRWHYEVEEIVRLMLTDDYGCAYSLLDAALDTVSVIEGARKNAVIIFPGDE